MFKTILEKLLSFPFVQKLKIWLERAGFTNLLFLAAGLGIFLFGGLIPVISWFKTELYGALLGIFCYINWNVIRKIWEEDVKSKIDDILKKL